MQVRRDASHRDGHLEPWPAIVTDTLSLGHGDIRKTWHVACECGMRTKLFVEGDDDLTRREEDAIKERLAKVWNGDAA